MTDVVVCKKETQTGWWTSPPCAPVCGAYNSLSSGESVVTQYWVYYYYHTVVAHGAQPRKTYIHDGTAGPGAYIHTYAGLSLLCAGVSAPRQTKRVGAYCFKKIVFVIIPWQGGWSIMYRHYCHTAVSVIVCVWFCTIWTNCDLFVCVNESVLRVWIVIPVYIRTRLFRYIILHIYLALFVGVRRESRNDRRRMMNESI